MPARPRCSVTAASAVRTVRVSGRPTTSRSWMRPRCSRSRSPSARKKKSNLPSLGRAGQVDEGGEVDLAARRRVAPHRGVVHPGEVGGEDDLLAGSLTGPPSPARVAAGRAGAGSEPARERSPPGRARAAARPAARAPRRRRWPAGRRARTPGRRRNPLRRPRADQASSRSASPSGVPANTAASDAAARPSSSSRRALARVGRGDGGRQEHDEVGQDPQRRPVRPTTPRPPGRRRPAGPRRRRPRG